MLTLLYEIEIDKNIPTVSVNAKCLNITIII